MSFANSKGNDNKGNNGPYQLAVLQLLDAILAATTGGGGSAGCPCPSSAQEITLQSIVTLLTPVAVTPGLLRVTGAGSVAAARPSRDIIELADHLDELSKQK